MKNFKPLTFLVFFAAAFLFFTGCQQESVLNQDESTQPSLQGIGIIGQEPDNPCTGMEFLPTTYTILSAGPGTNYPDYDLAVQVHASNSTLSMGEDCECAYRQLCVVLNFPQSQVEEAAITQKSDPYSQRIILRSDNNGSYLGYNDLVPLVPPGSSQTTPGTYVSGPPEHSLCITQGNVVLFSFPAGFPPGYDAFNSVNYVTGICIIDNLPDPNDPNP